MSASCTRPSVMASPSWCASRARTSTVSSAPTSRLRPRWTRRSVMTMQRRAALVLALALLGAGNGALAADYPTKPIKIVVPYAPGGGADAVARIVARKVSDGTGYHIVVENKGGAGAILGTEQVAKAEPDGYTLLLGQSGPISINPAVYKSLPYDPVKDFAPIAMTTAYPYILAVNAELPVKTLQEL